MPLYAQIKGPVGYETIGSPTMVDGIATGFSASNYYKLDTSFKPGHCTWEIVIHAKVTSFATKCNFISYGATDTRSIQVGTTTTGAINVYISSNGTSGNLANGTTSTEKLSLDTYYYILTKFTGATYEVLVSEDKENWTTFLTVNSSTPVWQGTYFTLGYNYPAYPEFLNGYLDFNESYIKIGDTIFWGKDFARVKLRTTPSVQYSVVGTPTIVNGVVSGFSNNPRADIVTTKAFPTSSPFVIQVKFNTGTLVTSRNQWILSTLTQSNRSICWGIAGASQKIRIYLSSNGSTWDIASAKDGTHALSNNTDYKVRLTFDGSKYVVSLLVGGDWIDDITVNSSTALSEQVLRFGNNEAASAFWPGSIDLNETYIKINNLSWFDGRFNNLTWTPHILEGDYGFNTDGKLVWASQDIYLQNDSTYKSYINTGIIPSNNITFNVSARLVDETRKDGALFGCRKGSAATTSNFVFWYNNYSEGYGAFNYGANYARNWSPGIEDPYQKHNYVYDGEKVYIDNVEQTYGYTANKSSFSTDLPIYLFGYNADGNLQTRSFSGSVYYFKFYDSGQLIRHLVPVPEGMLIGNSITPSNGMFDIVEQKFYENKSSNTNFIFGGMKEDYLVINGKLIWVNPNIYLSNDGTNNCIDTGFTAENNGYTYESDIQFVGTSRQLMGFGGNSKEYWGYTNSTSFELGRAQYITVTSANDRVKSKFTWSYTGTSTYSVLETLDINGSSVNVESLNNSTMNNVINNKKHYFIFKMNGYNGLYCNAKLYRHKIYDNNNNLVQYLVPVKQGLVIGNYTVPSNGLFDIVTQTFFANQGSGTFIFGKDN